MSGLGGVTYAYEVLRVKPVIFKPLDCIISLWSSLTVIITLHSNLHTMMNLSIKFHQSPPGGLGEVFTRTVDRQTG